MMGDTGEEGINCFAPFSPMAQAPRQTWKEKRDRLVRSDFVGRQEELVAFRRSVTDPEATTMIFAISGQGGVGKTTLLKEYGFLMRDGKWWRYHSVVREAMVRY
jgi:hypothetical protein